MAMIFELGLPADDLAQISAFMQPDYEGDVPVLSETGAKVLDRITGQQTGLWRVVVGSFVEYQHAPIVDVEERRYITPDGDLVTYADALMNNKGVSTGRYGLVIEDYENPSDAFQIGVPI